MYSAIISFLSRCGLVVCGFSSIVLAAGIAEGTLLLFPGLFLLLLSASLTAGLYRVSMTATKKRTSGHRPAPHTARVRAKKSTYEPTAFHREAA